jgi:hypothetical protein
MKPELRSVVLGLIAAGCAFAIVLAIARVHTVDLAAPARGPLCLFAFCNIGPSSKLAQAEH